jgi:hypothetical protein
LRCVEFKSTDIKKGVVFVSNSQEKEIKINIMPFLIEALVINSKLRKDIQKIYDKNKLHYYKLAKESEYYNYPLFQEGSIYVEEYGKKLLGILLDCDIEGDFGPVVQLVKKGYPKLYDYIKKIDKLILDDVGRVFINRKMNDDEVNAIGVISIWLAFMLEKDIEKNEFYETVVNSLLNRDRFYQKAAYKFDYDTIDSELKGKARKLLNRVEQHWGIPMDTAWLVEDIKDQEMQRYTSALMFVFDTENISYPTLTNDVKFTKKDFVELGALYIMNYNNMNKEEASKFLISGIVLKTVLKSYKEIKKYFFKNNKESMFMEVEHKDNEIHVLQDQLKFKNRETDNLRAEIAKYKTEYRATLEREIAEQEKELEQLRDTVKTLKENQKELVSLREYVFALGQDDPDQDEGINEVGIEIPSARAVVIGGHQRWQAYLKKLVPETFSFVSADALNFDTKILAGADAVFVNTAHISHALYYRVVANLAEKSKLFYLTGSPERCREEIARALSS